MIALTVSEPEFRAIRDGTQRHLIFKEDLLDLLTTVRLDCRDGRTLLVRVTGIRPMQTDRGRRWLVHLEPNADYVRRWEDDRRGMYLRGHPADAGQGHQDLGPGRHRHTAQR